MRMLVSLLSSQRRPIDTAMSLPASHLSSCMCFVDGEVAVSSGSSSFFHAPPFYFFFSPLVCWVHLIWFGPYPLFVKFLVLPSFPVVTFFGSVLGMCCGRIPYVSLYTLKNECGESRGL
jgi:hypothetical protein